MNNVLTFKSQFTVEDFSDAQFFKPSGPVRSKLPASLQVLKMMKANLLMFGVNTYTDLEQRIHNSLNYRVSPKSTF